MRDVVIAGYLRTAQSRSRPRDPGRDWLHKMRGDELLAMLLPELLKRANVEPKEVDDFLVGSAMGVSENWTYGGRSPIFLADFPETMPAKFVDQQCGSAMAATHIAYMEIATGNADIVMTGGIEHMTRVPMGGGGDAIKPNMKMFTDEKYKHWDFATAMNMGLTAEKLFKLSGKFTKEDMDEWAMRSHHRAAEAQEAGFFDGEILPIEAEQADGSTMSVKVDQAVRASTTMEALAGLKAAYVEDGVITAGVSSPLNAGATSLLLMAKETAEKRGLKPMGTIRAIGFAGVDPTIMGAGPVPATKKALKMASMEVKDIDFWEINEAFCIVTLNAMEELGIDPEKVNIHGGGVAIGHPLGATGNRLIGTLARILEEQGARWGCATACCGGGQGVTTIIEKED
ncbi:MAG: acetyl-CoA C-acetyltransferase [Deltaproteobacteria bacterium]|nr:acetyl-CoA C-acetyltransferase [Deltaproteobacteria bacterium]MBW2084643.1 acetyl-CoA C-acetyltransferase [Deltaproteobacteria bacterium]